jgi:glucan phosphoethanolaminetransferase (alkaline phosphatase superfamily)
MTAKPGLTWSMRQNAAMALKLFRSTGYSSIFAPGQSRVAMHPGRMIAAISAWAGFVCNVALWRELAGSPDGGMGLARALVLGVLVSSACIVVLSALGWRRTIKPAGTLLLLLAALAACSIWAQGLPVDASLLDQRLAGLLLPPWASLLRWQVSALLAGLVLAPATWAWNTTLRRLSASQQLSVTVMGILIGGALLAVSGFLLMKGLV